MATPKKRTVKLGITKDSFPQHLQRYIETKAMADEAAARLRGQRDALIAYTEKRGIYDDKGNAWLEADEVGRVKRERRVSNVFNADYAEEYLKSQGGDLWDECTETITVVNEDALLAAIYADRIPEDVADQMYSEKETFAMKVEEFG